MFKQKSDLFNAFCEVKALLERRSGCKLLNLQSDNGGEYCSTQMELYLTENGITHRLSVPTTPQQNGVDERKNRTLVEMARCMIIQSKDPISFWAEAISTANHIRNRCPSRSLNGKSPFEFWFGRKPRIGYFRTFGIKGFVLNKRPEKGRFNPRGIPCTFVGYSEVSKGFRVVLDWERHVSVTRGLKCVDNFEETETVGEFLTAETLTDCTHHDDPQDEDKLQNGIDIPVTMNGQMSVGLPAGPVTVPHEEAQRDPQVRCRGRPRLIRTRKRGRPRKQYHFRETSAECPSDETKEEPVECMEENKTVERNVEAVAIAEIPVAEAMESPDAREWYDAIKMEILSLIENNSWFIVERPSDRQIVGSRLVLCNKFKSDWSLERRKARLVAKGYTQQRGTDFKETFAPVCSYTIKLFSLLTRTDNQKQEKAVNTIMKFNSCYHRSSMFKQKSDLFNAFCEVKALLERRSGCKLLNLQSDNGGEYCSTQMELYLTENGITHRLSVPTTPQQNGVDERKNRTLVEMARCMIIQSKDPISFWAEAISTANHIRNRCPSRSLNGKSPFEFWFGRKPRIGYFRTFGIKGFVLNKRPEKGRFNPRGIPCTFVGYSEVSKGFRVVLDWERHVSVTRGLKCVDNFEETETVGEFLTAETLTDCTHHDDPQDEDKLQNGIDIPVTMNGQMSVGLPAGPVTVPHEEAQRDPQVRCRGRPRLIRTRKRGRPRKQYHFRETSAECPSDETKEEPVECMEENKTVERNVEAVAIAEIPVAEAMESPDAREWYDAIKMEILSLIENNSWFIVERPSDRQIVGSRLVLCNKFKSDWSLERRKARLVAKGYTQQRGTDFKETFAPVVRLNSIRTLMALTVEKGLTVHQLDVATAFLNGDLEEEIFMQLPDLLEKTLEEIQLRKLKYPVCKLRKAIYGLKQAGRQWYKKLDEKLRYLGMKPLESDPCLYSVPGTDGALKLVAIYVDDTFVLSNDIKWVKDVKTELAKTFKVRDLGPISYGLAIQFKQDEKKGTTSMSQRLYVLNLLKRFGMQNCKPATTPLAPNLKLSHLLLARKKCSGKPPKAYADADWGACPIDRRSYTGFLFKYGDAAVSWEARKQRTVALSSTEAEYMSLAEAVKETLWMRAFLREIDESLVDAIDVYNDNFGAQELARNSVFHATTKHIDIKYHFLREALSRGFVNVIYLPTEQMPADILTKGLYSPKHNLCAEQLGLKATQET
ncbi:hypothetical protein M514_23159 [Trichuris suis]|uniref:Integrase catalytic domain-containing protein n=2 Tax=Trichuris suis TaxID=68888 RepID=A0A085N5F5_9BILA|nr:hypothetical protein M514_23159 [Trichuris suis]